MRLTRSGRRRSGTPPRRCPTSSIRAIWTGGLRCTFGWKLQGRRSPERKGAEGHPRRQGADHRGAGRRTAGLGDRCLRRSTQQRRVQALFTYIASGRRHFLAYREHELVSHAVVTTRWVQPEGERVLKTAYVDAVATLPVYQGMGYASATMRRVNWPLRSVTMRSDACRRIGLGSTTGWGGRSGEGHWLGAARMC